MVRVPVGVDEVAYPMYTLTFEALSHILGGIEQEVRPCHKERGSISDKPPSFASGFLTDSTEAADPGSRLGTACS